MQRISGYLKDHLDFNELTQASEDGHLDEAHFGEDQVGWENWLPLPIVGRQDPKAWSQEPFEGWTDSGTTELEFGHFRLT